jgi:eukaryotic-like serine/threonine-protein kinase
MKMDKQRWQQIETIYHAALERAPDERADFLADACADDSGLLREVEELLRYDGAEGSFMQDNALAVAAQALEPNELSQTDPQLFPGQGIGAYKILALLAAGGMGVVYRARDERLRREVAIKVLPASLAHDADRLRRFEQEAHATSALNHPNILTIYDIGAHEGAPFIVVELLEGAELRAQLESGALPARRALEYAQQITQGLAAAHEKGIIHRDLKPENLFVTKDGRVKILDFGLAKLRPPQPGVVDTYAPTQKRLTHPGVVMGTIGYMSPEQVRGQEVDARSDIFSLGVVLYEMVAGRPPFVGVNALEVIGEILKIEPVPLKSHAPEVPAELQRIVSKALRKDREERYQTVKDLMLDLKSLKQEVEIEARLKQFTKPESNESGKCAQTDEQVIVETARTAATDMAESRSTRTTSSAEYIVSEIKRHKVGVGIALAILVTVVAGLVFGFYKLIGQSQSPSKASGPVPRVVPFTSYPGNECCPSFSPDGNQIAFAWSGENGDNDDIYIKLIDAESRIRLTTNPAPDTSPAWSPDGRYIAFVRSSNSGSRIFLVPALGGAEQELYSVTSAGSEILPFLSWSPDGKQLAFSEKNSPREPYSIYLLSRDTLKKRKLTSPPARNFGDYDPAFSPDGKTLAFIRSPAINIGDIYLVSSDGGESRRLTFDNRNIVDSLAWTPDGREIVFISNRAVGFSFWRFPIVGGTPERLAAVGDNVLEPAISRQGNRLAYTQEKWDSNIWRFEISGSLGRKSSPTRLIASTHADTSPQYSPDGKRIVFDSDRSGSLEIWVCDSDGSNATQLTFFGGPDNGSPRWSPDGRQIAFDSIIEGQRDIYVITADGGKSRRLTMEPSIDVRPSWSQDAKWVYFGSNRSGDWQVWKMPAEGGQAVQVTKQGGREACESPDGVFVYYTKGSNATSLWRTPVAGGEEVQVLEQVFQARWAVVEQGIYFINLKAPPQAAIEFFSFATGRTVRIATLKKEIQFWTAGFSVSPDGRWILLVQADQSESDIMLMENFR